MASTVVEVPPGTLLLGKYRVQRTLGKGGMGAVYEVIHEITRHRRALKLLHPSLKETPGAFERFLREASAAGRIGDAHIVDTFDAGETESGDPYVIMELLEGEPLTSVIARYPAGLPVPLALDLLIQSCDGVGAAHRTGIIHRDLKPDNLFVVTREGRPFVKVIDFGISKFEGQDFEKLTQTGFMMGTPLYMPVEQLGGLSVDERADVYALGVILYKCLSGKTPYSGTTLLDLAMKMTAGVFEPISTLRNDVPAELEALIHRVLSKSREARPRDAGALGDELRELQSAFGANTRPSLLPPEAASNGTLILTPTQLAARTEVDGPPTGAVGTSVSGFNGTSSETASPTETTSPTESTQASNRMGLALAAVAAAAAVVALGVSVLRKGEPAVSGEAPAAASSGAPARVDDAVGRPLVAPTPSASASSAAPAASQAPISSLGSSASPGPVANAPTAVPPVGSPPPTVPTSPVGAPRPPTAPGATRPAGGGLATDNPYK